THEHVNHIGLQSFPTRRSSDLIRVTSSRVFSPVRTRYVTDTQSGACPASAATVRSITSTSVSSRGAMNSNEMLGLLRASMSAIRSEEHTSELQSRENLVCRLLL